MRHPRGRRPAGLGAGGAAGARRLGPPFDQWLPIARPDRAVGATAVRHTDLVKEYVDFLGSQSPYDELDPSDLVTLANAIEVEYFGAGETIVRAGEPVLDHLWIVRTGAVDVVDRGTTVDQLGPGDTFGHISVLSHLTPALSVQAHEDTLCFRLPDPRTILAQPERLRYSHYGTQISRLRVAQRASLDRGVRSVTALMRPPVWCEAADSVADAARRIGDAAQSCALVRRGDRVGIVTDSDFRERVATGVVDPRSDVADLATFPVLTVTSEFSQATAFARMLDLGIHHLVVVGDRQEPVGVVRVVDFASSDIRSPLLIRAGIESALSLESVIEACRLMPLTVVELVDNDVPSLHVANILASVMDALLRKLLLLAADDERQPSRSWIVLGSIARREPLPFSDVDTAVLWSTEGANDSTPDVVRADAERLLTDLDRCGFSRCADGANATNPLFSRPQDSWIQAATKWMAHPEGDGSLLLSAIAIDSRPVTDVALGKTLTEVMRGAGRGTDFIQAFVLEALAVKPPTGFVRDFVVDHKGRHRGELNLKRRGLLPIAALGRWIAVVTGDSRGTTVDRLRRGRDAGLLSADESDTLAGAFEQIYDLLLHRDVASIRSGTPSTTFIDPKELDTLTRRHLRESFRSIALVQDDIHQSWLRRVRR